MRLVVTGAAGRMGTTLVRLIAETPGVALAGAVEAAGHPALGRDAGELAGLPPAGIAVTEDPLPLVAAADGILDFSRPAATVAMAALAAQARIVHVVGTTGLDAPDIRKLDAAARHAAIVRSGNMSLGVNLLAALTRKVAATLGPDFDIEIVEMHHRHKVDAPSGTALLFGEAAAAGRGVALAEAAVRGRDGLTGPRPDGAIGFASLRGGSVIGDHSVVFAGPGERVELVHRAEDRAIFARGALRAALWGRGRPPGHYTMADVLGLADL
ncbi:MAG TPA: 4-hydroxy-tetrahydrodipicolinate reductase [Hyphomicrobiales bacterium]|nr:4-hydroxy-tetrahydrodipicolinate reductase [Hyphomicrobiales bacterium]